MFLFAEFSAQPASSVSSPVSSRSQWQYSSQQYYEDGYIPELSQSVLPLQVTAEQVPWSSATLMSTKH